MQTVKVGETFSLLDETWDVDAIGPESFRSSDHKGKIIWIPLSLADHINWILPKKKVDEFMEWYLAWDESLDSEMREKLIQLFGDV